MKTKFLSHDEQILMVSVGLCAHLNNLVEDILAGDLSLLGEFQQMIQYAPDEMRLKLLDRIEKKQVS